MKEQRECPSARIEGLIEYINACRKDYEEAQAAVKREEQKLQDYLHKMEFAANSKERNRIATSLAKSRQERRRNKDRVQELEQIVNFCNLTENRKTLNSLKQLLGNQRKREEYLYGQRHYNMRSKEPEEDPEQKKGKEGN